MKNIKRLTMILGVAILMAACSKSNGDSPTADPTQSNLKQGKWIVTHFEERGKVETSKFSGYTLTFNEDGSFLFTNGTLLFDGNWSFENHSDDSGSAPHKLVIWISGNDAADQLQDDWIILEMTADFIRLRDDNTNHTEIIELSRV